MKCSNGHDTAASDYCDQCGVKIDGAPATPIEPAVSAFVAPSDGNSARGASAPKASGFDVATTAGTCPNCSAPKDGASIFCEDCGYDFVAGMVPASRMAAVGSATAPTRSGAPAPIAVPVTHQAGAWMIIVATDRAQFDRVGDASVVFPVGVPDRVVELSADRALIGRKSTSRNIHPEIDLSPTPEDVAVSRQHAEIVRASDGTFLVTDLGSSNGTFLNGASDPLAPNVAASLRNGDSVSVGAWTTLTLVLP
jgi:hypothetical protein